MLLKIGNHLEKFTSVVALISFAGTMFLVLINVFDVIGSKLFGKSITGTYEICEMVLMCTVFASFAYGQSKKTHIQMTLIIQRLPSKIRLIPYIFCGIISAAFGGIITYASFTQAVNFMKSGGYTGILHIPYYPFYFVEFVCMAIFTITLVYDVVFACASLFNKEYMELLTKGWE